MDKSKLIELKARLLCEGATVDEAALQLFQQQNPSGVKRGGLSSGGKMELPDSVFVNAPFYRQRQTTLTITADPKRERGVNIWGKDVDLIEATALAAPDWYSGKVGRFDITQIITAHNRQLVGAVYEDCLFSGEGGEYCKFCVMGHSLQEQTPRLRYKSPELFLATLEQIPVEEYGGLTLNGGLTAHLGRGMELIEPVVRAVHVRYPGLPIAVEIAPPQDLDWINRLAEAGVSSLMMNLECWDPVIRRRLIPGKDGMCPRDSYFAAFERAREVLEQRRVTTCFVVGAEPLESLREGIKAVIDQFVIPSPLAGRYFEDVPDYPFSPTVDWREFLGVLEYTAQLMLKKALRSGDRAGCVACRMCDLIGDVEPSEADIWQRYNPIH